MPTDIHMKRTLHTKACEQLVFGVADICSYCRWPVVELMTTECRFYFTSCMQYRMALKIPDGSSDLEQKLNAMKRTCLGLISKESLKENVEAGGN